MTNYSATNCNVCKCLTIDEIFKTLHIDIRIDDISQLYKQKIKFIIEFVKNMFGDLIQTYREWVKHEKNGHSE